MKGGMDTHNTEEEIERLVSAVGGAFPAQLAQAFTNSAKYSSTVTRRPVCPSSNPP